MKLFSRGAAAALLLASAGAHAADLGVLNLSTGSNFFGNTPVAGSFSDTLTFTLGTASFANASITSVVNGGQDVDFTSIVLTGPSGPFTLTSVSGDPVEVWATPGTGFNLAAGTYTLTLSGNNSAGIGSYAGNLAVSPVPEPQSLALALAGLGAMGFLMRRRRS
jgi:PEP-CTERM motif